MKINNRSLFNIKNKLKKIDYVFVTTIAGVMTILIIMFFWLFNTSFGDDYLEQAKDIVRKDYPSLLCTSPSKNFRVYGEKSYNLRHYEKLGFLIWPKGEEQKETNSFNLSRCEIK